MVAIALLSQTCAVGMTYGLYGTITSTVQTEFHTSRTLASSGMSVLLLGQALSAPFIGDLLRRVPVKSILVMGALCCAVGYSFLLLTKDIYVFLAIFFLVLGPAYCMLGQITGSTLVSNWFVSGRGRALGISNMPIGLFIFPPLSALVLIHYDMHGVFIAAIILALSVIPLLLRAVSKPSDIGQQPRGERDHQSADATMAASIALPALARKKILGAPTFWVIILGNGVFVAAGVAMAISVIPLAQSRGINLPTATIAASAYGVGAALGAPCWGWVIDRLGPSLTFVALALVEAVFWTGLLYAGHNVVFMTAAAGSIGFCSGGAALPLLMATLSMWLGRASFSRAAGLIYFFKLPFTFGAPILTGYLYDRTGNYQSSIIVYVVVLPLVAILFSCFKIKPYPGLGNEM
jgi:MFS family permease